jgi:hypothetical protein
MPDGTVEIGLRCRMCEGREVSLGYLTDSTYVWPDGLAHYAETHSVRLPPDVVNHVVQQQLSTSR